MSVSFDADMHPVSVLFLCTHNSARSILAEALLNHLDAGDPGARRFVAYSAGSSPRTTGLPNPLALRTLTEAGIPTAGLRSKSWEEFLQPGGPAIDLVITVCGNADQACPIFPGTPAKAHWAHDDPSAGSGTDEEKMPAFRLTLQLLEDKLRRLVSLPVTALAKDALQASARSIVDR